MPRQAAIGMCSMILLAAFTSVFAATNQAPGSIAESKSISIGNSQESVSELIKQTTELFEKPNPDEALRVAPRVDAILQSSTESSSGDRV